jgi:hypothetical protein
LLGVIVRTTLSVCHLKVKSNDAVDENVRHQYEKQLVFRLMVHGFNQSVGLYYFDILIILLIYMHYHNAPKRFCINFREFIFHSENHIQDYTFTHIYKVRVWFAKNKIYDNFGYIVFDFKIVIETW